MRALVIIPTYNEKENIGRLIGEVLNLRVSRCKIETLVVDDNSPDKTWEIVRDISKKNPNSHLLLRKKDRGRGSAGVAGFKYAISKGYDYVIEMDADFSHDPRYIPALLDKIKDYDVVLGSRAVKGGADIGRSLYRRVITLIANSYIRIMLGLKVKDCNSGFRCFRRNVLESIGLDNIISSGPSIVQEVLFKAHLKGFSITEIPIRFIERREGSSKLGIPQLYKGYLMILKLKFLKLLGKL